MKLPAIFLRLPFINRNGKTRLEPRDEPELVGSALEPEPEGQLRNDSDGPNVLVLDANEEMRKHYASYLGQYHYSYRVVGSTEEFDAEMGAQPPDIVILDHRKPQIEGFALAASLKKDHPELPVIMCTMNGKIADYEEFGRCNADKYLIKPVRKEDLDRAIRELLARIPKRKEAASRENGAEDVLPKETPAQPVPAKKKPGRKQLSFIDAAEALHQEFLNSNLTREAFAKKRPNLSVSKLQNEIRLAQMPEEVKMLVREEPSFFKKSFFEHILKLKNKGHILELCHEIREQGMQGNFYNLETVKERVAAFMALEKESKGKKPHRTKNPQRGIQEEALGGDGRPADD